MPDFIDRKDTVEDASNTNTVDTSKQNNGIFSKQSDAIRKCIGFSKQFEHLCIISSYYELVEGEHHDDLHDDNSDYTDNARLDKFKSHIFVELCFAGSHSNLKHESDGSEQDT